MTTVYQRRIVDIAQKIFKLRNFGLRWVCAYRKLIRELEDSVQQVAIFGRVEEVSSGATHVHVLEEAPPVPRVRRSDAARRLPSKFV